MTITVKLTEQQARTLLQLVDEEAQFWSDEDQMAAAGYGRSTEQLSAITSALVNGVRE